MSHHHALERSTLYWLLQGNCPCKGPVPGIKKTVVTSYAKLKETHSIILKSLKKLLLISQWAVVTSHTHTVFMFYGDM